MIQTGFTQTAHSDLVTDVSYDFYGLHLATCSLDQRIKIWQLDESNGTWSVEDDWKAHDAAVSKTSWAHPQFGSIIASSSFDRTVKIWEKIAAAGQADIQQMNVNGNNNASQTQPSSAQSTSRWVERAVLLDARGTVRAIEFSPHHFGLKLASISSDNHLRIYECLEQPSLTTWQLSEEIDIQSLPTTVSPSLLSRTHTIALATPTQTNATLEGASASLIAQALQQGLQPAVGSTQPRQGAGNREADGGWCISWCKERYWGEVIAAGCGISGVIKLIQLSPSRRPTTLLTLDPSPTPQVSSAEGNPSTSPSMTADADMHAAATPFAITSVAWAPSCGRSYHLIATGGRDGRVRIWRVKPPADEPEREIGQEDTPAEGEDGKWKASIVADFDQHKSVVGRVEWNITGTVLASAGNDGRVRLWKATSGNVWRPAGSIGLEQGEEQDPDRHRQNPDTDMET